MIKLNEKNYDKFTGLERAKLTIAALARSDDQEAVRLRRTCPKAEYVAMEYEYTRRLSSIAWVGLEFTTLCNTYHNKILLLSVLISTYTLLGDTPFFVEKNVFQMVEKFKEAKIGFTGYLKSVIEGMILFCNEIGFNSNDMIEWLKPKEIKIDEEFFMGVQAEKDLAENIKNKFLDIWEDYASL